MPPANGMHINTNGRRASGLENRVPALVSKDRCRATWKNRETRRSSRRRPCGSQCPLVQCCSTRPDKTQSWGLRSKHRAARQARCGVRRAHRLYCHCRPSALPAPFGFAPTVQGNARARIAKARFAITRAQTNDDRILGVDEADTAGVQAWVALEGVERRKRIEQEDRVFVAQLRAASPRR